MIQALTDWIFEVAQPSLNEVLQPAITDAEVVAQHSSLVEAIEAGDPERAERAMEDHLGYLRDALQAVRGP
jgi:DNA-binding FadR family transcriptional regulator